jgi:hypothetical protein
MTATSRRGFIAGLAALITGAPTAAAADLSAPMSVSAAQAEKNRQRSKTLYLMNKSQARLFEDADLTFEGVIIRPEIPWDERFYDDDEDDE